MQPTQPSTSDSASPRRRRWTPWILLALLVGVWLSVEAYMEHRLSAAKEAFAGSHSLDVGSYLPPPDLPPDAVNASDFIEAAALLAEGRDVAGHTPRRAPSSDLVDLLQRFRRGEVTRQEPSSEDFELVREALQRHSLALDVLDQGLENSTDALYVTDYNLRPFAIMVPELLIRLRFTALFRGRGELAMTEGRFDDAWHDARRIFQLAHWSSDDCPVLINALVARAVHHQGYLLTQRLYGAAPVSPEVRQETLDWALRTPAKEMMNRLLGAERAVGLDHILDPETPWAEMDRQESAPFWQRLLFRWPAWRSLNGAVFLEKGTPIFEACMEPGYLRLEESNPDDLPRPPDWAWLANQQYFLCNDVGNKRDIWLVGQDHLRLAAVLETRREAEGEYPEAFDVQAIDPFSGRPHVYRKTANGYELYSVSVNGLDDGGVLPSASPNGAPDWNTGDLVWRVERSGLGQ